MLLGKKILSWFSLNDEKKPDSEQMAKSKEKTSHKRTTSTNIKYNGDLVPNLVAEHKALLKLHGEIINAAKSGQSVAARASLVKFKNLLVSHLLKENTSLYTYLKNSLNDNSSAQLATDMKQEMDGIARLVTKFISTALAEGYQYDDKFVNEFGDIGVALAQRIENEESALYPAYEKHL